MTEQAVGKKLQDVRVLVLDDEPIIRELVRNTLSQQGAVVATAANGQEGLQILIDQDFDLLLVDLRMREMDGIAFLQEALKIWPWLCVVVMTGYAGSESLATVAALGVTRVVEKPFGQEDLVSAITAELGKDKATPPGAHDNLSLQSVQRQLRLLRLMTEPAMEAGTMVDALRLLALGLGRSLSVGVVGILGSEEQNHVAIFNIQEAVSKTFLDKVRQNICHRFEALSGTKLADSIRIQMEGKPCQKTGATEIGSVFSVPIITGGKVCGILTLASVTEDAYSDADKSFIYHAANYLSTVFVAMSRMRDLAIHDPITGIYNRLHLEREFQAAWARSRRYGNSMAVVIMDVDHFKAVNDTYGHLTGDVVLREFAALLSETARDTDIIGRYGGEEFVVILPEGTRQDGVACARRLLEEVRGNVFCADDHKLHITVSLGLAVGSAQEMDEKDMQRLLAEADAAMYMAKRAGRNCLRIWSAANASESSRGNSASRRPEERRSVLGPETVSRKTEGNVLVVDDDPAIRQLLQLMLQKDSYTVTTAESGARAVEMFTQEAHEFDIVLADLQMPGMSGIELLKQLQAIDDSVIRIIVSGHATVNNAIESLRQGAYDFIQKPFKYNQLSAVVRRALDYRRALQENKQYQRHLSSMVRKQSAKLRSTLAEIKGSYDFTLEALVGLMDARERDFGEHSKRVRELTVILARTVGVSTDELDDIARGALLHDVGKIGIPDHVLLKPGALTDEEWEIMRRHPAIGYRILASSSYLKNASEIVYAHQECYDGSGYPRGLKGSDICLGARIFSIADAYDAMRSDRVYRAALPLPEVMAEIQKMRGSQFDPAVVDAFMTCHEALAVTFDVLSSAQRNLPTPP